MRYCRLFSYLLAAALVLPLASNGQNRVEVKKDFENDLTGANKSGRSIVLPDSLKNLKTDFRYEILEKQFRNQAGFSPLPSANIFNRMEAEYPVFLAKAGFNERFNPELAAFLNPDLPKSANGSSNNLSAKFGHLYRTYKAGIAKIDGDRLSGSGLNSLRSQQETGIEVSYGREWKKGSLNTDVFLRSMHDTYSGFSFESLPEYGSMKDDISSGHLMRKSFMKENASHSYSQFGWNASLSSVADFGSREKFHYDAALTITSTLDEAKLFSPSQLGSPDFAVNESVKRIAPKLGETYVKADISGGPSIGRYADATIGVTYESAFYSKHQDYHHSLFDVYASTAFTKGKWSISLGAKASLDFNNKKGADGRHVFIAPMISAVHAMIENSLYAYVTAEGGNSLNNYSALLAKYSAFSPLTDMRTTAVLDDIKVGLRGAATRNLSFNIYGGYANRKSMAQIVTSQALYKDGYTALDLAYSNHVEIMLGGELSFKSESFDAGVSAKYSYYDKSKKRYRDMILSAERPYGYAPFEAYGYAKYRFRERITVGADARLHSKTPQLTGTKGVKSRAYANIGLYGEYSLLRKISIYAQLTNILDNEIIDYANYMEKGFGFNFGVLIKL